MFCIFPNHALNFGQIPDPKNTFSDPGETITDHGGGVWVVVVLEGLWFSPLGLCSGPWVFFLVKRVSGIRSLFQSHPL